jgi:ketosteroid isomerase-like protein
MKHFSLSAPLLASAMVLAPMAQAQSAIPVEDQLAIHDTIARMNQLIDAEDYETYVNLWAEDATFDSGFTPESVGREPILEYLRAGQAAGAITGKRHVATNIVLDTEDDRIIATYYLSVMERQTMPALVATAFITDEFEERDGRWMVVRHVTSVDPALMNAMEQQ